MFKKPITIILIAVIGLFSCKENPTFSSSKKTIVEMDTLLVTNKSIPTSKHLEYIHTSYDYSDDKNIGLIIENSYPKGGSRFVDSTGKEYVYSVFWTQLINTNDNAVDLNIEFPKIIFDVPKSINNTFRITFPPEQIILNNTPDYDYGFTPSEKSFENGLDKPASLHRKILPRDSTAFYVVTLFYKGADGAVRSGFHLKDNELIYTLNGKEISCGSIEI